jgi:GGDEF domain-containing protein
VTSDAPPLTLSRQGLAARLDACFEVRGAPAVTLLQFEVDSLEPATAPRRRAGDGAGDGALQRAVAATMRSRVRGGDLVACLDDGAVVVGCVGAAPSVTGLLLERLRAAVGPQHGTRCSVSAGRALFCATRERCERALHEIDLGQASAEHVAAWPVATERRRSAA